MKQLDGPLAALAAAGSGGRGVKTPLSKPKLFAGSLGCGNDLVKTRVIAQIIPARIQEEIAVCWRSERSWDCRNFFELFERAIALAGPRVNQRQVGNGELLFERDWVLRLLQEFLKARLAAQWIPEWHQF